MILFHIGRQYESYFSKLIKKKKTDVNPYYYVHLVLIEGAGSREREKNANF